MNPVSLNLGMIFSHSEESGTSSSGKGTRNSAVTLSEEDLSWQQLVDVNTLVWKTATADASFTFDNLNDTFYLFQVRSPHEVRGNCKTLARQCLLLKIILWKKHGKTINIIAPGKHPMQRVKVEILNKVKSKS